MLNGDDEKNPFSDFKLIFPFNEEDVWRAYPSLSGVSIPSFPQSVRYFGYRVVPSPDFNQDGQDDFWVVSFVNESWMNDSSPSYPLHEGERDVVVWLISLISSPQVEDGVFIKDVMYSNLTFQPFPSSHPRRTFGESISSIDDGLVMGAPDVGGSSEGWVYDIQFRLPDFETFPEFSCQSCVDGGDFFIDVSCLNFFSSSMKVVCGSVEDVNMSESQSFFTILESQNRSAEDVMVLSDDDMMVSGESENSSQISLNTSQPSEERNLSIFCLGWVSSSPSPPLWRMEASRFDLTLPRTLFSLSLFPPISSFLTVGVSFSTSHEGNVSCVAVCEGGCGWRGSYERFIHTQAYQVYSATFFGLKVGMNYSVSCSGVDFASSSTLIKLEEREEKLRREMESKEE